MEGLSEIEEPLETSHLLSTQVPPQESKEEQQKVAAENAKTAGMTILGMAAVAAGTGFLNAGGCVVAIVGGSALEFMMGRWIVQLVLASLWWIIKKPPQNEHWYGDKGLRLNIWTRGFLYFLLCYGWYRGLELVPIGDAEAIIFIAPLLIVVVARVWLKEELSLVFPGTVMLTVAGIVFVCQPDFIFHGSAGAEPVSIVGLIFLIVMSFAWAGSSILVRTAQNAHWTQILIVTGAEGAFLWTPLLIVLNHFIFQSDLIAGGKWNTSPSGYYVGMVALCGLFGFFGIVFNVIGYQLGDASKVAWMEYLDLIFAYIFQYAIFGEPPNLWEWIGLACLLSTCVLHLGEELVKYVMAKNRVDALKTTDSELIDTADTLDTRETKQSYESACTYTAIKDAAGGEGVDEEQKTVEISG